MTDRADIGGAGLTIATPNPGITIVRLDRPERRNALDLTLVGALLDVLRDRSDGVVVLSSSDPRWFCSGADLKIEDAERATVSDRLYDVYEAMVTAPVPIIAAVSGPAVGGGAQLAAASDLRIAGPGAWFRFAGVGHGLAVGSWCLPAMIGRGRAFEVISNARAIRAEEAMAIGLVERLEVDPESAAVDLALRLQRVDGPALTRLKAATTGKSLAALWAEREGNSTWRGCAPSGQS